MSDASLPTLAVLAERYGLRRMPGMSKPGLIARIVTHLSAEELVDLEDVSKEQLTRVIKDLADEHAAEKATLEKEGNVCTYSRRR